jgi:hypothetical protein
LPSVSALKTAVQVELELLAGASVHVGVTVAVEPAGWLVTLKLTVPSGALFVPEAVSLTVAVQVAGVLAGVEAGQSSVVEVERAVTLIVSEPLLEAWIEVGAGL